MLFSSIFVFSVLFLLFILDFLLTVTLSGSVYKLSLADGSNINIKADNVNIHRAEFHPCDGIHFFLCYHSLVEVLLYLLPTTSNDLHMCEAHDMRARICLSKVCVETVCHLISGSLITAFNFNENRLSNSIDYLLNP